MKVFTKITIGLLAAAVISGCGLLPFTWGSGQSLENTDWLLISYRGKDALIEAESTVFFQNGELAGSGGCNSFGGQYDLLVGNNRIEINDLVSTLMFCVEPEGVMDQEAAFLEILNDAERFEVANERLKIYNSGNEELIFKENE